MIVILMLTHCGTRKIDSARLILRKFDYSDTENMLEFWISDPEIQFLYFEPIYRTKKEVKKLLAEYVSSYEKQDYYRWAIIEKRSSYCIGQIAYFLIDTKNHFGEIEFCIGKKFQEKGYGAEAIQAILDYGFNKINLHKVQVCHEESNLASKALIKKSKFVYEGTLRDYFFMDGDYGNRSYYSMLKKEYESMKKNARK